MIDVAFGQTALQREISAVRPAFTEREGRAGPPDILDALAIRGRLDRRAWWVHGAMLRAPGGTSQTP
jgi:hypothetical protein